MKRVFLSLLLTYAGLGHALPVDTLNHLQDDSLVEQVAMGLNPSEPPPAVMTAWRSTFLLVFLSQDQSKNSRVGSAFVVAREINGDTQTIDLLTADHVVEGYCDGPSCTGAYVFDNGIMKTDGKTEWVPQTQCLPSPNLRVIDRRPQDDLALVRITTKASLEVEPVTFAAAEATPGDRVFAIGYPKVFLRKRSRDPDPKIIKRRWSEGEVLGVTDYGTLLAGEYLTTDADALPGNSGGPVVNAYGEVTGVLGVTGAGDATGFAYIASPNGANRGIQGASVRLDKVKTFLADLQIETAHRVARRSRDVEEMRLTSR